jgi:hypothetical protein
MVRRSLARMAPGACLMGFWVALSGLVFAQTDAPPAKFQLQVSLSLAEGATPPQGVRILRYAPKLDARVPAALIDSREIQFGRWRDWPTDGKLQIDLQPSAEVAQYSWRIAAFERNDLRQFLVASKGFGEIPVGLSDPFPIELSGGQRQVSISIQPVILIQPQFSHRPAQPGTRLKYSFRYGPMGRPPRRVVGIWNGLQSLPLKISPFAYRREAVLSMQLQSQPDEWQIGPVEFALQSGLQKIQMPELPAAGPLWVGFDPKLDLVSDKHQDYPLKIGFDRPGWGPKQLALAGFSASSGLTLPTLRAGIFKFLVMGEKPSHPRYFASTAFDPAEPTSKLFLQPLPPTQDFAVSFPELNRADGPAWDLEVRGYWGPFFLTQSAIAEGSARLIDLPGIRYLALARRLHLESGLNEIQFFLDAQKIDLELSFRAHPTQLQVDGSSAQGEYTLRLMRGQDGPDFPPRQWQPRVTDLATLPYLPLPFRGKVLLRGLPDGNYEGALWGFEGEKTTQVELEYLYFETH